MNAPRELSVALTITPEISAELAREAGALEAAQSYVIDSPQMAQAANVELRSIKARIAHLKELRAGFVAPAKQIIANAEALFDGPIESNLQAETHIKGLLTNWTQEQERQAAEARAKAEAEARRIRQEAEARAAAERAKAEEAARVAREKEAAAEAERQRQAAEAERLRREGDAKAAAEADRKAKAAAAEAAKQQEAAAAATENGAARAQAAQMQAAAASVVPIQAPQKLDGFALRSNWIAELEPGKSEADAIVLIVDAIAAGRRELLSLLRLDMSAANKLAKALKANANIPGMRVSDRPVAASRRA